jgi:hypothetical protein
MDNTKTADMLDMIEGMVKQIEFLSKTQLMIVNKLSKKDKRFQMEFIAMSLAQDEIREGFTNFLEDTNAPDELKLFMMEMNEVVRDFNKEEE